MLNSPLIFAVVPIVVFFTSIEAKGSMSPLLFFIMPVTSVALVVIAINEMRVRSIICLISNVVTNITAGCYINDYKGSFNELFKHSNDCGSSSLTC